MPVLSVRALMVNNSLCHGVFEKSYSKFMLKQKDIRQLYKPSLHPNSTCRSANSTYSDMDCDMVIEKEHCVCRMEG